MAWSLMRTTMCPYHFNHFSICSARDDWSVRIIECSIEHFQRFSRWWHYNPSYFLRQTCRQITSGPPAEPLRHDENRMPIIIIISSSCPVTNIIYEHFTLSHRRPSIASSWYLKKSKTSLHKRLFPLARSLASLRAVVCTLTDMRRNMSVTLPVLAIFSAAREWRRISNILSMKVNHDDNVFH